MPKWILIFCLSLAFVFGLVSTTQAREIASFLSDNLGQLRSAVLREGPKGGLPVLVDDHLRVAGYVNIDTGIIVRERPGGLPVIIGDDLRVDGWLFANKGIVRDAPGKDPVVIADHLRIEGEISRAIGAVNVKDDLEVAGKLTVRETSDFIGEVTIRRLKITGKLEIGSILDVEEAIIHGAEARSWIYFHTPGRMSDQWCPPPCTWYALNDGFIYGSERFFPVPYAGRVTKLAVYATKGPDPGNTHTIIVRKNGADTGMQVVLRSGEIEGSSTAAFDIRPGDRLSIRNVLTGVINTYSAENVGIALEIETRVK